MTENPPHKKNGQITFIRAGLHTTLQDSGRFGYQDMGIGPSGASDKYAMYWANKLLGNAADKATLEIFMGGLQITFSETCQVAITGADVDITVNNTEKPNWSSFNINPGETLKIGAPRSGLINYIAISGSLQHEKILDSHSINTREKIGPNLGSPFSKNDTLAFKQDRATSQTRSVHWNAVPNYNQPLNLRFIPSRQFSKLDPEKQQAFLKAKFTIGRQSNKLGTRLEGSDLQLGLHSDYSEPVCEGSIQLPPNGQPVVLLADRQTIGGYPKIGTVYKVDCWRLSQRRAQQEVGFELGSIEDAQKTLLKGTLL